MSIPVGISRRDLLVGTACFLIATSRSKAETDTRVAIVDTAENAANQIKKLKARDVRAVARYYARQGQPSLPEKRLAFNKLGDKSEANILTENGIALISVYQYFSNNPKKFVTGLSDTGSTREEAKQDAKAALEQASMVGQPEGSVIYFGVDFNLKPTAKTEVDAVIQYFQQINETIGGRYKLGTYGNGFANRLLRDKGLVAFSWISASRSFAGTADFVSSGDWHLFQNQVDRYWFGGSRCPSGMGVDTDIQNPKYADIGIWGASGSDAARTQAIFDSRRFAKKKAAIHQQPDAKSPLITKTRCRRIDRKWTVVTENRVDYANNVQVVDELGDWLHVDVDDDGVADGYCQSANFTADFRTMPIWP
ncbi:MAG: DUF1906 domain-containing protein [Methyloceanibacter sp.]